MADAERALIDGLGLPAVVARVLVARGVTAGDDARVFLNPSLDHLPDPAGLPDLGPALDRLQRALRDGERILVHGDYDADGTCGAALLTGLLRAAGGDAHPVVPDRRADGYGLSVARCRDAVAAGTTLVITTDVGSADADTVAAVAALGCDVLVTDHHEMPGPIPAALAVVNPRRMAAPWPLCGAGVAWMLGAALLGRLAPAARARCADATREAMELATVATVADVAPLRGINRTLVALGLRLLEAPRNPGLAALSRQARLGDRRPTVRELAFQLIPRLNAVGRVDDPRVALDLLTTRDPAAAAALALACDRANRRRQRIQKGVREQARAQAADQAGRPFCVVAGQGWNAGVIGIVAGQLSAETGRPTAVIAIEGERAVGSARSGPGVDLVAALASAGDLLDSHGGHARAAGFTCAADRIDALRRRLWAHADARPAAAPGLPAHDGTARLAELVGPASTELGRLAPFGEGNPPPRLRVAGIRRVGGDPPPRGTGVFARTRVHLRQDDTVLSADAPPPLAEGMGGLCTVVLEWQRARPHWRVIAAAPAEAP